MTRILCLPAMPPADNPDLLNAVENLLSGVTTAPGDVIVLPAVSIRRDDPGRLRASEAGHPVLGALGYIARRRACTVVVPDLAVRDADGVRCQRSFVLSGTGTIIARRTLPPQRDAHRSEDPEPEVVIAATPAGPLGLCSGHDLAAVLQCRRTARAGAEILLVVPTGAGCCTASQWSVLNRALAIDTSAHVIAPARADAVASDDAIMLAVMLVDPWGRVLIETHPARMATAEVDRTAAARIRAQLPFLDQDRLYRLAGGGSASVGTGGSAGGAS